jgi:hypothetical protein
MIGRAFSDEFESAFRQDTPSMITTATARVKLAGAEKLTLATTPSRNAHTDERRPPPN